MYEQFFIFVVSLLANAFSALSGGGAGLIQFPLLIFLGLNFGVALATHKLATVALGIGATLRHLRENSLDRNFSLFMCIAGLPGVILGASIILEVPDRTAQLALGMLIFGLGVYSVFSPQLGQNYNPAHRNYRGYLIGAFILFLLGILNGSLTSGTGLFVTLWIIKWFGLDYKRAVAYTLVLVGLFWNAAGAITLGILGEIYWLWLPPLILGSLFGGYIGAHLAIIKGNKVIKRAFELITVLIGIKLIIG